VQRGGAYDSDSPTLIPHLQRMYALFSRIPSTLEILRDAMGKYIKQLGVAIVADQDTVQVRVSFICCFVCVMEWCRG